MQSKLVMRLVEVANRTDLNYERGAPNPEDYLVSRSSVVPSFGIPRRVVDWMRWELQEMQVSPEIGDPLNGPDSPTIAQWMRSARGRMPLGVDAHDVVRAVAEADAFDDAVHSPAMRRGHQAGAVAVRGVQGSLARGLAGLSWSELSAYAAGMLAASQGPDRPVLQRLVLAMSESTSYQSSPEGTVLNLDGIKSLVIGYPPSERQQASWHAGREHLARLAAGPSLNTELSHGELSTCVQALAAVADDPDRKSALERMRSALAAVDLSQPGTELVRQLADRRRALVDGLTPRQAEAFGNVLGELKALAALPPARARGIIAWASMPPWRPDAGVSVDAAARLAGEAPQIEQATALDRRLRRAGTPSRTGDGR